MLNLISYTSKPSESVARLKDALKQQETVLGYGKAVTKLDQYTYFTINKIPAPKWTINVSEAKAWQEAGNTLIARTRIRGQAGAGILVVKPGEPLPEAKVYTEYVKKLREFRVNLFQHQVLNVREKLKKKGFSGDTHIRSSVGYVTTHPNPIPEDLKQRLYSLAEAASKVSTSDFTGVDIGYNKFKDYLFVLEVNSGPSIEGSSVTEYVARIKEVYPNEFK